MKKEAFSWAPKATQAFEEFKNTMCKDHVLVALEFTTIFIVECDSSGNGIGDVLIQEGHPISFESQPVKGNALQKPIYEKEVMEILHALKKWCPCLIVGHFNMKTDHGSIKYIMEQILSLEEQQKLGNQDVGI